MTSRLQGVLFDAGNTLIRVETSVGDIYARVAAAHGHEAPPSALEDAFRQAFARRRESFLPAVSLSRHTPEKERAWWRGVVEETFREAGSPWPDRARLNLFFEELYETFARPEVWRVFPDVAPTLAALEDKGLPLAVVSNWDSRLTRVLTGLRLAGRFRYILTSAECGFEKPDPAIFLEAAKRMGEAPERLLYVGDHWLHDVEGSRRAGMKALWIDREGKGENSPPERIASLEEVAGRIQCMARRG